ncbi:CPBP family intramembrane glutamic endopeptidase [Saccharibacillus sacchari]|uniref:CPBP family intramembrane glutamic endopeptidase n=1 Tax=Saccharibacillus sacchari TaxID=456493 RepID=A0ACC6P7X1_9BACL
MILTKRSKKPSGRNRSGTSGLFFLLVVGLSLPFWLLGEWMALQMLPDLPIDALMVICPAAAALILTDRQQGKAALIRLLRSGTDWASVRPKVRYVPILLTMPAVSLLAFCWLRWSGVDVPLPHFTMMQFLIYLLLFTVGSWCEEIGWTGYATEPLMRRFGVFGTSLVLGLFSVAYHLIPLLQVGGSAEWIFWWSCGTIALRVLMAKLYLISGRSLVSAILFHMTINMTWQLFPINGSYYDPAVTSVLVVLFAIGIAVYYGPHRPSRHKADSVSDSD